MKYFKLKAGVTIENLKEPLKGMVVKIALVCKIVNGEDYEMTITSANDGNHIKGSKHYSDEAIDIRTRDMEDYKKLITVSEIKRLLGKDYDVVFEMTHIHIEYDPKEKESKI